MQTRVLAVFAASVAFVAPAAWAQGVTPKLAPGVKPAPTGYEAAKEKFVAANPTPIFSDLSETSMPTGQIAKVGEPVDALAKVQGWDWYLVGRGGTGVGYVPRSLLRPAT